MAETWNALLDQPIVLAIVLAIGATCGMLVEKFWSDVERQRKREYWQRRNAAKQGKERFGKELGIVPKQPDPKDFAADQLKTVMKAQFKRRALLNKAEGNVFRSLDSIVIARNPNWQVMAQVSVGEFVWTDDKEAFLAINSKRVDFVLMDGDCQACHALEYQGDGHHQGSAAARDAVKKEALRRAGIGYHEIVAGHTTPAELKRLVDKLVPEGGGGKAG